MREQLLAYAEKTLDNCCLDNHQLLFLYGSHEGINLLYERFKAESKLSKEQLLAVCLPKLEEQIRGKEFLYGLLADEASRRALVRVAAMSALGPLHVRFPAYGPEAIQRKQDLALKYVMETPHSARVRELAKTARCFDLGAYYPGLRAFTQDEILYSIDAGNLAYEYRTEKAGAHAGTDDFGPHGSAAGSGPAAASQDRAAEIRVEEGDVVLECGACFGENTLIFSELAGKEGKILSLEPNPDMAEVFKINMSLNPALAKKVRLCDYAAWNKDGETLNFNLMQGGSGITGRASGRGLISVRSITLDSLAREKKLPKVDFIKMDIEGAEPEALQGAEQILRAHRPKLAVCIYHAPDHYRIIPEYLHSLNLGYRFYLDHHSMNDQEVVLYAKAGE